MRPLHPVAVVMTAAVLASLAAHVYPPLPLGILLPHRRGPRASVAARPAAPPAPSSSPGSAPSAAGPAAPLPASPIRTGNQTVGGSLHPGPSSPVGARAPATLPLGTMAAIRAAAVIMAAALLATVSTACSGKAERPRGREADPTRDRECRDPARPRAYFYPAEDRTHYAPDDPFKDGCEILVPDHLFCCPPPAKPAGAKP